MTADISGHPSNLRGLGLAGAIVMALAFLVHNVNGLIIEPRLLGFDDPVNDYAKVEKLQIAMQSWPWLASGFGHLLTGFAVFGLGLHFSERFRGAAPTVSRLLLALGIAAGTGFLLVGVTNVGGTQTLKLLSANNPELTDTVFLAATIVRVSVNSLAIVAMGSTILLISYGGLRTSTLPRSYGYYGYVAGLSGLIMAFAYIPVYLLLYLVWAVWTMVVLARSATRGPGR